MKKRYLFLAVLFATAVAAAGCGKKKDEDTAQDAQVTVAPAENTDGTVSDNGSVVDMQKSEEDDIKNVIGDKTTTAAKLILVNGIRQTVQTSHLILASFKPACCTRYRFLYIIPVCHTAWALIKGHCNGRGQI